MEAIAFIILQIFWAIRGTEKHSSDIP